MLDNFRDNNAVNSLLLSDFSYQQSKKLYTQLMEKFISGIIDGPQFDKEFSQVQRLDRDKKYSCEEMLETDNRVPNKKYNHLE